MSPPSFGYLRDLDAPDDRSKLGAKLEFQFQPESMKDSHGSGFHVIAVPGHSEGRVQFGGGAPDEEPLTLHFVGDDEDQSFVSDRVDWLLSLTFPDYDGSGNLVRAPHTCLYVVGAWKNERVKVVSVNASYGKTFDKSSRYPRFATVEVLLRRHVDSARDYLEVRP